MREESTMLAKLKEDKIMAAQKKVDEARSEGNPLNIVAAESELAALQAEKVTGLKPIRLAVRGRRGRGRGRGK